MSEASVTLSLPTNQTREGPRIACDQNRLVVAYDSEDDKGVSQWAEVIFTEPLFYQFCDGSVCEADDVVSSKQIRRQSESDLLASVLSRWDETVGWQEW